MPSSLSAYYLPTTQQTAEHFVTQGVMPDLLIERVAFLVMLMAVRSTTMSRATMSRALFELHDAYLARSMDDLEACLREARADILRLTHVDLWASLLDRGIRFAPEEQMARRAWCGADGRYTEAFQERCRDTLIEYEVTIEPATGDAWSEADNEDTNDEEINDEKAPLNHRRRVALRGSSDQARAAIAIAAAPDERFSLIAYAGTGKTHVILTLAQAGGQYTHLAPTLAHHQAFQQRAGYGVMRSVTLYQLATRMAKELVRRRSVQWRLPPRIGQPVGTLAQQAQVIGVPSLGGKTPEHVLITIYRIIRLWCYSPEQEITIDLARRAGHAGLLDEAAAYVAWAQKVWALMSALSSAKDKPTLGFQLYHLVKWLDTEGAEIPPLGTLLVDEAHDLPAPWYAMLHRYPQGCVTMGDPYQCLSGRAPKAPHTKALTMAQSVRAGEQAIPLFQSVLDRHSERLADDDMLGSRDHMTRPRAYASDSDLPTIGLRVYGSIWKLLEDALRLKSKRIPFGMVRASETMLREVTTDAILLRRTGDWPKSYSLRDFKSWDALAHFLESSGHAPVVRLFERGFSESDLEDLLRTQRGHMDPLVLGLLEHCKNLEFSTVTLSRCCFSLSADMRSKDERDRHVKAIYVAITRVRDELWLPRDALDQLS